jgi:hypothetical protein
MNPVGVTFSLISCSERFCKGYIASADPKANAFFMFLLMLKFVAWQDEVNLLKINVCAGVDQS